MRVVLVNPPKLSDFPGDSCIPPLGLLYIASVLEKNGHEVHLVDAGLGSEKPEKVASRALALDPEIVGITSMTPTYPAAAAVAGKIRAEGVFTVMGGPHVTFRPEEALEVCDAVVMGEGELSFSKLAEAVSSGTPLSRVPGISFKKGRKIVTTEPSRIRNLDDLPMPAYHLLDFEAYQKKYPPSAVRKTPWISYSSSRGCPFGCFYCSVTEFWGRVWRGHSAGRVAADLRRLTETYSLESVFFVDDNFTFRRERIMNLCSEIKDLGIEWCCSCRVDQVDGELLKKMSEAGCWRIGFGIEAGTQEVIDWYGKRITIEKAKEAVRLCRENGISPFCFFIIGAPVETEEMMERTIEAAKEIDPDIIGVSFLTPFPGSKLYDYAEENGLLLTRDWKKYDETEPTIKTPVPWERIVEMNRRMYREFYFRPKYIFRRLRDFVKNPALVIRGLRTIWKWVR